MNEGVTLRDYEQAEAELRKEEGRVGLYVHGTVYVAVNILLVVLNLAYAPQVLWFFFPLIGWGIGLMMHYLFAVHFAQRETEAWQAKVEHRAQALHA